jgi:hypothetical protein
MTPQSFASALLFVTILLSSCGGTSTQPASTPTPDPNAIQGNWHLTGHLPFPGDPSQGPVLTLAVGLSGKTIYAIGDAAAPCSEDPNMWFGGPLSSTGTKAASAEIAADGSFSLNSADDPLIPMQFTIQGNVPSVGSSIWQGRYTLFTSPSLTLNCSFNLSGTFTATPYRALNGTYAGSINGSGLLAGMSISMNLTQGSPNINLSAVNLSNFDIPMSGTVTVDGTPCFISGTISSSSSSIRGDYLRLFVTMNNGSFLSVSGWLSDESGTTLKWVSVSVLGPGQCASAYGTNGTLVLQP